MFFPAVQKVNLAALGSDQKSASRPACIEN
jgi:hypothetical protein